MLRKSTLLLTLLFAVPAAAHSHYPWECCSNMDCRPTPCDALEELDGGRIQDLDSGLVYDREKVKLSTDNKCHICTEGGKDDGAPICVFIQAGS